MFCALFAPAERARRDGRRGGRAARPRGGGGGAGGGRGPGARRRPPRRSARTSPRSRAIPASTCSATPTGTRSTSASRSACARARGRTSRRRPSGPARPSTSTTRRRSPSSGALLLEDRLIKALRPPGNKRGKRSPDGYVYLRCRLDIAFPILEVALEPAGGHAVTVGPVRGPRGGGRARRAAQLAVRPAPLRPPAAAARAPERVRADGPLPVSLPRRPRPQPLPRAARRGAAAVRRPAATAAPRCSRTSTASSATAVAAQNYERAAWLQRRRARLEALLRRLGGVLRATHAGTRLVLAPHPAARGRFDAFWIAGGRVVDWGALPADPRRAGRALRRPRCGPRRGRSSAAGCRPTRWRRRGSSAPGWRRTSRRRSSSARARSTASASRAGSAPPRVRAHDRRHRPRRSSRPRPAARRRRAASSAACWVWRSCPSPSRWRSTAAPGSRCGDQQLHVGIEPDFAPARQAHPAFAVDGAERLAAVAARLGGAGVEVTWDQELPGITRFYASDPWGNRLEFTAG